jgi:hypothetical protein
MVIGLFSHVTPNKPITVYQASVKADMVLLSYFATLKIALR